MNGFCIIFTTTDNLDLAKAMAIDLVSNGLAKCVQREEIESTYSWNGEIVTHKEYRLSAKCTEAQANGVMAYMKNHSQYDIPEIIRVDIIEGDKDYLKWISS
jgi:uncharacterized protein involved in tolerance to divalent cations